MHLRVSVSANSDCRGEQKLPSTKTSHVRGRRWHRQERQLVWFVGRHGGSGDGEQELVKKRRFGIRVTRDATDSESAKVNLDSTAMATLSS